MNTVRKVIGFVLVTLLLGLSIIHAYWALGGPLPLEVAVPSENGKPHFIPSASATWLVSLLLIAAGIIVLGKMRVILHSVPHKLFEWGLYGMSAIFLLRSIGDFKYCGFFKTITDTGFSLWDSQIYTPFCLLLALLCLFVAVTDYKTNG